jgi:hypothetical protein
MGHPLQSTPSVPAIKAVVAHPLIFRKVNADVQTIPWPHGPTWNAVPEP